MKENCGRDREVVNAKIRAVMDKRSSASSIADAEVGDDDDDDANDIFGMDRLSQESLILDIYDSGKNIRKWTKMYNMTEKAMETCFLPSNNKENDTENA